MLHVTFRRLRMGAAALPLLVLLAIASPASAVTVGQTGTGGLGGCASGVYADTNYVVPAGGGTINSFSIQTDAGDVAPGNSVNFKLLRPTGGNNYLVVGESGPKVVAGTGLETFAVNIPAQAGDILGMFVVGIKCHRISAGGVIFDLTATDPAVASTVTLNGTSGSSLNESANLVPAPVVVDYATNVLADTPAGYWRFNDLTTAVLADSSGNGNNGTYLGNPTLQVPGALVNDPANKAVSFDGIDDIGRVPDSATLDVGSSFTLQGWVRRTSDAKTVTLFNKGTNGFQLVIMSGASGGQVFLRKTNVSTIARSNNAVPADGLYHHIVATMNGNGSTAKIYVDGVLDTVIVSAVQTIQDTAFPLLFGSGGAVQADFDEFALYNGVLTATDVLEHYNAGRGI